MNDFVVQIKVSIIEDDDWIRQNLASQINQAKGFVCGECFASGEDALKKIGQNPPNVVLMDINLPRMNGIECVRRLKKLLPSTQVLMLTVYEDSEKIFDSLLAGASGYLLKTASAEELIKGIMTVAEGKAALHPSITRHLLDGFAGMTEPKGRGAEALSQREHDVLQLLAFGKTNKEIAKELGIGAQTVKTHISHIFTKMGAADRTDAVALALRKGLVQ